MGEFAELTGRAKAGRPEMAFIGRSNVGKSSLINMLTNKKGLALVSKTPGACGNKYPLCLLPTAALSADDPQTSHKALCTQTLDRRDDYCGGGWISIESEVVESY